MTSHLGFGHSGIDQANDPSLDAAAGYGNFFPRLEQAVVNRLPLPKMRLYASFRIGLALSVIEVPEAGNPTPANKVVKLFDFCGNVHPEVLLAKHASSIAPIDAVVKTADHLDGDPP